jgi:hypothetical protein
MSAEAKQDISQRPAFFEVLVAGDEFTVLAHGG